jgi:tetratricopeptide (TPR) repeat protein
VTTVADALSTAWQYHQAGALGLAEQIYRQVVAAEPRHADAWHALGVAVHQQGRHAEAVELIARAIAIDPANPTYYCHLGAAQGSAGQLAAAEATFRQALAISPLDAQAWFNLATAAGQLGRADEAIAGYERTLEIKPDFVQAWFNLGNLLRDQGRKNEAAHAYQQAVRFRPDYAEAYNNLGSMLHDEGRLADAAHTLQAALRAKPAYLRAKNNLGTVLTEEHRLDEAVQLFEEVIAADPQFAEAYNNLGVALLHRGELAAAANWFERAIALWPDYADAYKNRAVAWLFQGDFARGWPEFEWRWKSKGYPANPHPQPYWDGAPLPPGMPAGGTLLLHAEQGLGDALQFVRFVALARERAARVVVVCQPPLVTLLKRCAGLDDVLPQGAALPAVDAQASFMSLPGLLGVSPEASAEQVPYLRPASELVERWRAELAEVRGLKVGIVWQGNPQFRGDQFRSAPLEYFRPLSQVAGVTLFSLQKGSGSEQMARLGDRFSVIDLAARLDNESGPFMDTAAVMANLDLVISSDTAAAHLAGALGVPVWVALAHVPEWRWLLDRGDSPWYPSMRLFRQPARGDWRGLFERMAAELALLAASRKLEPAP